jgi:hypothetical protein
MDRIESDRIRSEWNGSVRIGSARLGSGRLGSVRLGSARLTHDPTSNRLTEESRELRMNSLLVFLWREDIIAVRVLCWDNFVRVVIFLFP